MHRERDNLHGIMGGAKCKMGGAKRIMGGAKRGSVASLL